MKALIVSRTRRDTGGITFDGRSVRLVTEPGVSPPGLAFAVGEVWEVEGVPPSGPDPAHGEDLVVRSARRLGPMSRPDRFIEGKVPPVVGGPEALFEGLTRRSATGSLYVDRDGLPASSVQFWRPAAPLHRVELGGRFGYRYADRESGPLFAAESVEEPVVLIPAGSLVQVSLSGWSAAEGAPEEGIHCVLELAGWFLEQPASSAPPFEDAPPLPEPPPAEPEPAFPPAAPVSPRTAAPEEFVAVGMDRCPDVLREVFGYDCFRPMQEAVIGRVLGGQDTLAVMPTGGGKSLCYQLPALLFDGLTVVVSPLISLMRDQVDQLRALGVPATFLNSSLGPREYQMEAQRVEAGEIRLVYLAPETLRREETLRLLDRSRVRCFAIDEAHCISQWGHDFRPEYRQLLPIRKRYSGAVCLALTATAAPRVREDIQRILGVPPEGVLVSGFDRPNLFLSSRRRSDGTDQVLEFLETRRDQSGIVYCSTRDQVETLAAELAARGFQARPYHAGLDAATRDRHQREFSRDEVQVVVATIAFGMGINKSNVRFVLHYNLPESVETYYQEVGRAGRDGLRSECLLLFNHGDARTVGRFIEQGAESERAGRQARLNAILRYAGSTQCRRAHLLPYFGEPAPEEGCGMCDNCVRPADAATVDVTAAARDFLLCVQQTGQVFGTGHLVDVLRGSQNQRILARRHDRLSVYGAGRERSAREWRRLADLFLDQGLVEQDLEHGGLRLAAGGRAVLRGEGTVLVPEEERPAVAADTVEHDPELFEGLRRLRKRLADAANVPPYVLFSDRTLVEMATYYPQSDEAMLRIHGVGHQKLAQHGAAFLEAIREHCAARGLEEKRAPGAAAPQRARPSEPGRRCREVGTRFAEGASLDELEGELGIKRSTLLQHLVDYARAGGELDPGQVLDACRLGPEERERVLEQFAALGTERLGPVFAALEGTVPYEELHLLRLYLNLRDRS